MKRADLERNLALIEKVIAWNDRHIARQRELIEHLHAERAEIADGIRVLRTFLEAQARLVTQRDHMRCSLEE